jgi:hypothetical protein
MAWEVSIHGSLETSYSWATEIQSVIIIAAILARPVYLSRTNNMLQSPPTRKLDAVFMASKNNGLTLVK